MSELIQSSFGPRSTALEVIAGHDLRGKRAVVTGGSSGIGVETARALAAAGAAVTLTGRDDGRVAQVVAQLRAQTGSSEIHGAALDLGSPDAVRAFAARLLAEGAPLHILINNAGIMACPQTYTDAGYESQFATNHLGHFLLTGLLLPALRKGAPARVVSVSSSAHRRGGVDFADIHFRSRPYDKWAAYAQSKSANCLFAVELHRRFAGEGISANAVMPGGIMTGLQKHLSMEEMTAMGWLGPDGKPHAMFKTPEQGAATSIWAAVGPELAGVGGLYLEDCRQAGPWRPENPYQGVAAHALSPEAAAQLWEISERLVEQPMRL